jgi:hypothetical protein
MADQQVNPAHPGCSPPPQTQGAAPGIAARQQSCFAGRGLFQSSALQKQNDQKNNLTHNFA